MRDGTMTKSEIRIKGQRACGLVMNTRRDLFADWRVRQAMIEAFNFEYINDAQTGGRQIVFKVILAILSWDADGPAADGVTELLTPFVDTLPPDTIEGYRFPISDGSERNRKNMRRAATLLDQAGYRVVDGQLTDPAGDPVSFKILLRQGAQEYLSIVELYMDALSRLGISVEVDLVDGAQYAERRKALDFDMTPFARPLSPGNEQRLMGAGICRCGRHAQFNGVKSPALDALIDTLNGAKSRQQFLMLYARWTVSNGGALCHSDLSQWTDRIAHKSQLKFPSYTPIYGIALGSFLMYGGARNKGS